jgi:hypothetical protein
VHYLQATYERAYVQLTRLVAEYEQLVHSHTCQETVVQRDHERKTTLSMRSEKLTTSVTTTSEQMRAFRWQVENARSTEVKLRGQVSQLMQRCQAMDATVVSLDRVRDVIHVMNLCPGLPTPDFRLPRWIGTWVEVDIPASTDDEVDHILDARCAEKQAGARSAETSEIGERSVLEAPAVNTAEVPLLGTCPNCAGEPDIPDGPQHVSGHARVCWDPKSKLTLEERRTDCGGGRKALMCVTDQPISIPTSASPGLVVSSCPMDVKKCPCGQLLSRDSGNYCEFPSCPPCDSYAPLNPSPAPFLVGFASSDAKRICPKDFLGCSDGSFLARDPARNCAFPACPTERSGGGGYGGYSGSLAQTSEALSGYILVFTDGTPGESVSATSGCVGPSPEFLAAWGPRECCADLCDQDPTCASFFAHAESPGTCCMKRSYGITGSEAYAKGWFYAKKAAGAATNVSTLLSRTGRGDRPASA